MLAMVCCLALVSCGEESLDYNHPDVDLFVKQLKAGKYSAQSPEGLSNVPKFAKEDIEGSRILFGRREIAVGRVHSVDGGNGSPGT